MPRIPRSLAKKVSDKLYNARRRLTRQATSLEKQASAIEAEKGRATQLSTSYRTRAESLRTQAQELYAERITAGTGAKRGTEAYTQALQQATEEAVKREIKPKEWARREQMTLDLLSTKRGSKFYAATSEIWNRPGIVTYSQRNRAIMEYFDADSMYEVIQRMSEATGTDFTEVEEKELREKVYQEAALKGALYVASLR